MAAERTAGGTVGTHSPALTTKIVTNRVAVHDRGDVNNVPDRLQDRLERMAERPHKYE